MPDITLCKGETCPLKSECKRANSPVYKYQSYFMVEPYDARKNECCYYTPIQKG